MVRDRILVRARFSTPVQTGPGAHPASCTMGTGSFPGVKSGRGVTLNPHPLLMPWSTKSRSIPLLPLWALRPVQSLSACTTVHFTFTYTSTPPMDRTACTEPQCLYNGALYLFYPTYCRLAVKPIRLLSNGYGVFSPDSGGPGLKLEPPVY